MNYLTIIYVGDPMCSWCWGIAPALKQLKDHYQKEQIPFQIVVGGLRPGGGDPWNDQMKDFLRHHWDEVLARSGQPFGYDLLKLEHFNYDTEPACRAVVAARSWLKERELNFFEAIQRKFYVDSKDPGQVQFYESICDQFQIEFSSFQKRFENKVIKDQTQEEFDMNRKWGIRGYPSVMVNKSGQQYMVTNGFASFEQMWSQIEKIKKAGEGVKDG